MVLKKSLLSLKNGSQRPFCWTGPLTGLSHSLFFIVIGAVEGMVTFMIVNVGIVCLVLHNDPDLRKFAVGVTLIVKMDALINTLSKTKMLVHDGSE